MAALSTLGSHHVTCTYSVASIKPRRTRFTAAGLARLVGATVVAFASIALAQPAGGSARSEPGVSVPTHPLSAIPGPEVNVRTKSTAAAFEYYQVPGYAFQPVTSGTTYTSDAASCIAAALIESSKCWGSRKEIVFVLGFRLGNTTRCAFIQAVRCSLSADACWLKIRNSFSRGLTYGLFRPILSRT